MAFSYVEPFGDEQRQGATLAYWQALPHLGHQSCPPLEYFMASPEPYLQQKLAEYEAEQAMSGDEAIKATMRAFGQQ